MKNGRKAIVNFRLYCAGACALIANAQGGEEPWFARAANILSPSYSELAQSRRALELESAALPALPISQQSERLGWHSQFSANVNATKWLQVDLGAPKPFDAVVLVPVDVADGAHPGPGFGFPVRFRVEVSDDSGFAEPRLLAALDETDFPNPGNAPVYLATTGAAGRFVRITATRLWPRADRALLALGELFVLRGQSNLAAGGSVTVSDAISNAPTWQAANATDNQSVLGAPVEIRPTPGNGWHARIETAPEKSKWVQVDLGREVPIDEVRLFPARPKDFPARRGFGFPPRFKVEVANDADFLHPVALLDQTQSDFDNPAENPVIVLAHGARGQFVRVTATRLWARTNDYIFALAELEVWSAGNNLALGSNVSALDSIETGNWSARFLVDGFNSQGQLLGWSDWLRGLSRRRELELALSALTIRQQQSAAELTRTLSRFALGLILLLCGAGALLLQHRARQRERELERLRQRIASDLHDEIGSNLGSIALLSQMAMAAPSAVQSDLAEINQVAQETADSMRELVWFIKPSAGSTEDYLSKLRETAARMLVGLEWSFEATGARGSLEFRRQLFLILKEALHNIRRHASARTVAIRLTQTDRSFEMRITDDGSGFDPNAESSGHGLASMRQRAEALAGVLTIDSQPGRGTELILTAKMTSRRHAATA